MWRNGGTGGGRGAIRFLDHSRRNKGITRNPLQVIKPPGGTLISPAAPHNNTARPSAKPLSGRFPTPGRR
ncbi:hypothetical protein E2C01_039586 [Portunus trituberculatus]|uniref:Uncharacterized protein n=1 Tax=Portunus trituberculatus TaxID=210409 RepID=A0A5B7FE08_PORTR|nr:hypothetical protein [Portunus trituberculatus]